MVTWATTWRENESNTIGLKPVLVVATQRKTKLPTAQAKDPLNEVKRLKVSLQSTSNGVPQRGQGGNHLIYNERCLLSIFLPVTFNVNCVKFLILFFFAKIYLGVLINSLDFLNNIF